MKGKIQSKGIVIGIVLLFFGAGIISSIGGAFGNLNQLNSKHPIANINRGTLYVGGSGHGNYTTIQDAIDNASNGDTIFVFDYSSPYFENLVITKTITLMGEDKKTTDIDGSLGYDTILINANNVIITGFSIVNSNNDYSGIQLAASSDCTITLNNIEGNGFGVSADYYSYDNRIYHNNFIENSNNAYDYGDNDWDDGKRYGNYWSDYEERYPDAKKLPIKRIWNTPYEITGTDPEPINFDDYPLIDMGSWVKSNPYTHPRVKPYIYDFSYLNWFFERFPNLFLILQDLLGLR